MHRDISTHLNQLSNNLTIVNKLIIGAYLEFNSIKLKYNRVILSYIEGNDKKEVSEFIELVKIKNGKFDFEDLIRLFEITIPSKDTITNGAVYTPKNIRDYIVKTSFTAVSSLDHNTIIVGDIACGTGAFLYSVSKEIKKQTQKSFYQIFKDNIFGLDISDYAIERTKILLTLLALSQGEDREEFIFNLFVGNALSFDWYKRYKPFRGFDIVVGNPPYVRSKHLSKETQQLMSKWEVTKSGNSDLYIPFFEIALKCLKDKTGILGYITVNTFKRSLNARKLRSYLNSNRFNLSILDFGSYQVFNKKSTYTCIVFIQKSSKHFILYEKINPKNIEQKREFSKIEYALLDDKKGWLLNTSEIVKNIKKIESIGIPLGEKYPIKNGLATLSNTLFIFKPVDEDENYYYHQEHKIEKSICRDIIKPNRLKREEEIEQLKEKIIFPYYKENRPKEYNIISTKMRLFDELYFKENFPYAYSYLFSHKKQLLSRDKGKSSKKYAWYEFGRTQALADYGEKLLFPYMSNQAYFVYSNQKDLLFYAGYAIFLDNKSQREIELLKIILKSKIFWYYIEHSSKPYSGNFFALAKNYVKDFGICELSREEEDFLLDSSNLERDEFLVKKYGINFLDKNRAE
jgi:methylase of polypeptide subunit release factors